jgi:hypothetical protein
LRSGQYVARRWSPWVGKPPTPDAAPVVAVALPPQVIKGQSQTKKTPRFAAQIAWFSRPAAAPVTSGLPLPVVSFATAPRRKALNRSLVLPFIPAAEPVSPAMEGARRVHISDFHYAPIRKRRRPEKKLIGLKKYPEESLARPEASAPTIDALRKAQTELAQAEFRLENARDVTQKIRAIYVQHAVDLEIRVLLLEQLLIEEILLLELIE